MSKKKMLQFTSVDKQNPPKRDTGKRKEDFKEIYDEFISEKAKEQSSRCSQCGVPFCICSTYCSRTIPWFYTAI